MTQTSPLLRELLNAGIGQTDAGCIDQAYSGEPDWMDGMEQVARVIALKEVPTLTPPTGQPWKDIHISMAQLLANGTDHDQAWRDAIAQYDAAMQFALTAAIKVGMKNVLDQEAQKTKRKLKTTHFLKQLDTLGYQFRMNMCDDAIEVTTTNGTERLTDGLAAVIYRQMVDNGFQGRQEIESCYIAAAYKNRYHPVREYLTSLTYDGGQYIQELASFFQDEYNKFPTWLRKWLIGACAKAFVGAQNAMLVLDGPQDIGKSSFARWICPISKYFVEAPIDPDNKDDVIKLINKFVWEVGELEGTTSKASRAGLKNFLTIQEVTVRVPYGHFDITRPALASMIGTVNNAAGILNDPTGNRRFNISKIMAINWDYQKLDINKIWSEAMAAYLSGKDWRLSVQEKAERDEINEEYQVEDPVEGLLRKFFKLDTNNTIWWMSSTDIAAVLENPYQGNFKAAGSRATLMALSETMKKLGHKKGKQNNVNGYFGIDIGP
jgi:predicted P-loop ATPase